MRYDIRPVKADQWRSLKELRLTALSDPAASLAFLTTYAQASAYPDERWQENARSSELGLGAVTYVGVAPDGSWAGMVTVLLESPDQPKAQIVGLYVRPEHRRTGLAEELLLAAVARAMEGPAGAENVFLSVHEQNVRAQRLYEAQGFVRTGDDDVDDTGQIWEYARKRLP
ncbi:N-acetyltransferase [Streptomyces sp. Ru73]|uniref:GNAT family N-acetyltransferase n=1 Tax=Streptomyces sp. Ru73 TaxID=2080748 RepID=UPI000D455C9F|nr:GNAT family N-acetyltransferase [Streptomyces sp. Ru73]POX41259.1 N-acetyltransferase [Streptomyces sp. Ru73]